EFLKVSGVQKSRHLSEPRRSVLLHPLHENTAASIPAEPSQGFQNRPIGLTRAILLNTLAPPNNTVRQSNLQKKRLDQCRLTHPRLPSREDSLTLAVQRFF